MKKLTILIGCLCMGLAVSAGGIFQDRIAFCQEEEEEVQPAPAHPRPYMQDNPMNRTGKVADDGLHGDGKASIKPKINRQRMKTNVPARQMRQNVPKRRMRGRAK